MVSPGELDGEPVGRPAVTTVLAQDFAVVSRSFEDLYAEFSRDLKATISQVFARLHHPALDGDGTGPTVVSVGEPAPYEDGWLIPLSWHNARDERLAAFDGDLEVTPSGLDETLLVLRGRFHAEDGADAQANSLSRRASVVLRNFLGGLAAHLSVPGGPEAKAAAN